MWRTTCHVVFVQEWPSTGLPPHRFPCRRTPYAVRRIALYILATDRPNRQRFGRPCTHSFKHHLTGRKHSEIDSFTARLFMRRLRKSLVGFIILTEASAHRGSCFHAKRARIDSEETMLPLRKPVASTDVQTAAAPDGAFCLRESSRTATNK